MSLKETVENVGNKISETATKVGHKISENAEQTKDWAKEKMHVAGDKINETVQKAKHAMGESHSDCGPAKSVADIQPHMEVIASCGTRVGTVDHMDGANSIKLTKNDPKAGGEHHWIPTSWVAKVDRHVHLNLNSMLAFAGWKTSAA